MPKISDAKYNQLVEKNARHGALIHVEMENPKKVASVMKDVPVLAALEYLFKLAEKYRKANKHKKVSVILEAVALIDRKTGKETDVVLESRGTGKNQNTTVFVGKLTPAQVFAMQITKQKHDIKELKKIRTLTNPKKEAKKVVVKKVTKKKVHPPKLPKKFQAGKKKVATKKSRS